MLRKIIFACATAVAVFVAASAASTEASAGRMFGGFVNHNAGRMLAGHGHRHVGTGGAFRRTGGHTRCWFAECGGGEVPVSGEFVLRGCVGIPYQALPPWCQGIPSPWGSNAKGPALRR